MGYFVGLDSFRGRKEKEWEKYSLGVQEVPEHHCFHRGLEHPKMFNRKAQSYPRVRLVIFSMD